MVVAVPCSEASFERTTDLLDLEAEVRSPELLALMAVGWLYPWAPTVNEPEFCRHQTRTKTIPVTSLIRRLVTSLNETHIDSKAGGMSLSIYLVEMQASRMSG